ncbi:class I adenylate-forming enzyme family protein [Deinococcus terrestris]|uniref:class I adenylate-forming enzyme family protein n=1 Tax=Deinococcus terrestris TaxID=2651870 RepID=UPI001884012D|nr:AMP-binding protein [Deinococcus terrestris]
MRAVWRAVRRSGLLSPTPASTLAGLLGTLTREGPGLYALAAWWAGREPGRVALVDGDGPVTFGELRERADRVTAALAPHLRPGQAVGLRAGQGANAVAALLGALRLGLRVTLLNPAQSETALGVLVRAHGLRALLVDAPLGEDWCGGVPVWSLDDLLSPRPRRPLPPHAGRPVLLTSGTTGEARVVRRSWSPGAALASAGALLEALNLRAGAPTLLPLPLFHGHGLAALALGLGMGAPVHLAAGRGARELWATLERERIEVLVLVPTVLHRLLAEADGTAPALRTVVCGSAPLDPALAVRARERLGHVLFNLYGSTEAGLISLATPADLGAAPGTVGRPLPGVRVRLEGDRGEIAVGRGRATGDLGRWDAEGRLFVTGRADDLLLIGGENVFPAEVEARIAALPGVRECAVYPVPDAEYGQALHAFVVPEPDAPGDPEWHAALRESLPRRLRPLTFTRLPELPRTPSGKVQRWRLRKGVETG